MKEYFILFALLAITWGMGFIFGRWGLKKHYDGIVTVDRIYDEENNEERDRIIFSLGIDLDDIKNKQQLCFKVDNKTSQKSHTL